MIPNIVQRAAFLLALQRAGTNGVELRLLKSLVGNADDHLRFLRENMLLEIDESAGRVCLRTPVSFDVFQSVPPEIRNEVETIADRIVPPPPIKTLAAVTQKAIIIEEEALHRIETQGTHPSVQRLDNSARHVEQGDAI